MIVYYGIFWQLCVENDTKEKFTEGSECVIYIYFRQLKTIIR